MLDGVQRYPLSSMFPVVSVKAVFCLHYFVNLFMDRLRVTLSKTKVGCALGNIMVNRGRNKPKLPLVRRISDMLQTTCPPTCPLVQVLVHFVGPKLDARDRQNSGQCKG